MNIFIFLSQTASCHWKNDAKEILKRTCQVSKIMLEILKKFTGLPTVIYQTKSGLCNILPMYLIM